MLFASDLIEHDDGDLRDLPLIDRKRRLAELIGKAKRAVTRDGQIAFPKNWSLRNMPAALSVRQNSVIVGCAPAVDEGLKTDVLPGVAAVIVGARNPGQARVVSAHLESAAAPATAFATSSWPRSGCEMVSRPTALVRRSSPTILP